MLDWKTSRVDWQERILAGQSLMPDGLPLFPEEAEKAMAMFRALKLIDVPYHPTLGDVSRSWVLDWAQAFFGSYDAETGRRLIRYWFLLISKKNGKSSLAAGIMLTALIRNWRDSAEFLILSPTIEVANNSFFPARDMIRHDDELSRMFQIQEHTRTIIHRKSKATLKVVAADSETVSGKKAVGVLVDELWLFGHRNGADAMLAEAIGGLASNPEGFVMYLSTQSDKAPAGVFDQLLTRFRAIRDGQWADGKPMEDNRSLGVLYEFPRNMLDDESYRKPENWKITNPNLGASVDEQFLQDQFNKAEGSGEAQIRTFSSKHLNVQVDVALRNDSWAGARFWKRGIDTEITLDSLIARCEVLIIGIDGGGLDDLLGLCVMGRERGTKRWLAWFHAYISPEGMERRKNNATVYDQYIKDGDLTLVAGLPDDLTATVALVKKIKLSGLLGAVGADKMGLGQIVDALAAIGVTEELGNYVNVRQGIGLMPAFKALERKLTDGTFKHDGSKMMEWCVGNAKIAATSTATRISREDSGQGKIDPLMAGFNAAMLMEGNPKASGNYSMMILGGRR